MPHKHKRKRDGDDSHYELPPTEKARPLATSKGILFTDETLQRKGSKWKRPNKDDDTPAAFKRLMAFKNGIKPGSGLDDGLAKSKRKGLKATDRPKPQVAKVTLPVDVPKIRPGERMKDFSTRVDATLPLHGLAKKNRGEKDADGIRRTKNKTQRRQQNMQKEWREIDARWKEKVADAKEEADEKYQEIWRPVESVSKKKKRKSGKGDEIDGEEGDVWAAVGSKQQKSSSNALVGLHDVVQDIPRFTVAPREKMRIKNGAMVDTHNIPQASGSLKRREELSDSRRKIIEGYRDLMTKRAQTT